MGPKFWELIIVLAIVILLFGPSRLAGLGGAVGKAMREFRDATLDARCTNTLRTIENAPLRG